MSRRDSITGYTLSTAMGPRVPCGLKFPLWRYLGGWSGLEPPESSRAAYRAVGHEVPQGVRPLIEREI